MPEVTIHAWKALRPPTGTPAVTWRFEAAAKIHHRSAQTLKHQQQIKKNIQKPSDFVLPSPVALCIFSLNAYI